MEKLTSIDYANLIRFLTYKQYGENLNKTQILKLLFICYGLYLTETGDKLFDDDSPKAWPYGPVFPRVYKKFCADVIPSGFSEEILDALREDKKAIDIIQQVIDHFHSWSAQRLSLWSHEEGGPWWVTLYGEKGDNKTIEWNKEIKDDLIKTYFGGN